MISLVVTNLGFPHFQQALSEVDAHSPLTTLTQVLNGTGALTTTSRANVRKAKEISLARYECLAIVIKKGWALDYHVDFAGGGGQLQGKGKGRKGNHSVCTMM